MTEKPSHHKQSVIDDYDDDDEAEDMVSLRSDRTGIDNAIFVSSGHPRHAARIKIAVDPPKSFNPRGNTASMSIHTYNVEGELPTRVRRQAELWIELNRDALLLYWHTEIDTEELLARLKKLK